MHYCSCSSHAKIVETLWCCMNDGNRHAPCFSSRSQELGLSSRDMADNQAFDSTTGASGQQRLVRDTKSEWQRSCCITAVYWVSEHGSWKVEPLYRMTSCVSLFKRGRQICGSTRLRSSIFGPDTERSHFSSSSSLPLLYER